MFNLHLTREQIEFRDTVRSFAVNEIKPLSTHPDRLERFEKPLMKDLVDRASQIGLRTMALPEEAGGVGGDMITSCIILEELAVGDVDIAITLGQTALLGGLLFDNWMSKDQCAPLLQRFVDDHNFHLAIARPNSDNLSGWYYFEENSEKIDAQIIAVQDGDSWIIDGLVHNVVNAPIAELIIVSANTQGDKFGEDGANILLVPRDAPGLFIDEPKIAPSESRIRWHHGYAANIEFKRCKVPASNLIKQDMKKLNVGKDYLVRKTLQLSSVNLGLGRAAFETAVEYGKIRRQGGRNIIEHQGIGKKISEMALKLELASTMIRKAAWVSDHPEAVNDTSVSDLPLHIIANVFTAEAVHDVTLLAAECFGAMGVMRDIPAQKYVDDGFIFRYSDANDLATRLRIAEAVVK